MPKKSFGQHFLHDQHAIEKILQAAMPEEFTNVVEVGPGPGALTSGIVHRRIAAHGKNGAGLTLLEADADLIANLEETYPKATVVRTDAAKFDYGSLPFGGKPWLLIGNLPYNAASAIIMQALAAPQPPARLVVMVQKEVGERMLALPHAMSVLSVAIGVYATVEKVCIVLPGAFFPPPKVDSMVLRLAPIAPIVGALDPEKIIGLAKVGFASRRKFLSSNLAKAKITTAVQVQEWLIAQGLSAMARAEELSVGQWEQLANTIFSPTATD